MKINTKYSFNDSLYVIKRVIIDKCEYNYSIVKLGKPCGIGVVKSLFKKNSLSISYLFLNENYYIEDELYKTKKEALKDLKILKEAK